MGSPVYFKTTRGHEELDTRHYGLSTKARRLLILTDGTRNSEQLVGMSGRESAEAMQWLGELIQAGMITTLERVQASAPATSAPAPSVPVPAPSAPAFSAPTPTAVEPPPAPPPQQIVDPEQLQAAKLIMLESIQQYMPLIGADIRRRVEDAHNFDMLQSCVTRWHLALRESPQGRDVAQGYLDKARKMLFAA